MPHLWRQAAEDQKKLDAARKVARRRYNRESPVRNDDLRRLQKAQYARLSRARASEVLKQRISGQLG